jgi:hypothetical protein
MFMEKALKKIKSLLLITGLLLLFNSNLTARQLQADLDFTVGAPQGEFNDQLGRLGVGLNFSGGYQFRGSPFMLGLDIGYMNFGVESREEPLSTTIPDLRVRVENSYNLATGNIFVRFLARDNVVRPYLDGLVGFNYLYTETVIKERGFGSEEPVLRDTNFEDIALNYGFGAGLKIRVYTPPVSDGVNYGVNLSSVYVNISSRYLFGNEAEYLKEGSITRENGQVTFDVQKSRTDLLHFKIGVGFLF